MVPYRREIRAMLDGVDSPGVAEWTWIKYRGLSDLYVAVVDHYLSCQKRFTYSDLERLVRAQTVQTGWEELIWRDLISLRAENAKVQPPDFFIQDDTVKSW